MTTTRHDIEIIRGDSRALFVGLADDWVDLDEGVGAYEGRLVFRERQEDNLPELLVITSPIEVATDPRYPALKYLLDFSMTPVETQSLPDYPVVYFIELRLTDETFVRRLVEGRVKRRD